MGQSMQRLEMNNILMHRNVPMAIMKRNEMQTIDQYFNNTLVFVRLSMKFWEKIPSFPCNNCVTKPTNCLSCQESFESGDNYLCLRYESPCLACEGFDLDATNHNNKPCQEDCQKCSETSESE